jgi:NAD(P)-dependent dehydrogenase (short-subunit alcohol dehydrogenase family)
VINDFMTRSLCSSPVTIGRDRGPERFEGHRLQIGHLGSRGVVRRQDTGHALRGRRKPCEHELADDQVTGTERRASLMKDFAGKIAVITGGGTGMGRELARQLVAEGCNVAMCDISADAMAETKRLCEVEPLPQGLRITTHVADVSIEDQLRRFRDELIEQQATDKIHLLFNNAGIGGGGSLFTNTREQWERTFNICWGGVYLGVRTFLPLLLKADEGHIVNTSSVNGFWASVGLGVAHTSYSAAKFAVKGFTEALINDLRLNAPHVKCSVVMPGHIGTSIISNSRRVQSGTDSDRLNDDEIALIRRRLTAGGTDTSNMSDEDVQKGAAERARNFHDEAPTTAAAAAKIILDGVKAERWRILVGDDARRLDERVRQTPEHAYDPEFYQSFVAEVGWRLG